MTRPAPTTGPAGRAAAPVGRPVATRLRVTGWLETRAPLHVGGLDHDPDVDLPVAVDGASRLYVPGTSLAGVCRAALRGASDGTFDRTSDETSDENDVWGFVDGDDGAASRIVVRDGLICATRDLGKPLPPSRLQTRTSVGIDRALGTAAGGFLFSRAVVPAGAWVALDLDLESRDGDGRARDRARLAVLLDALAAGEVTLGAATTRGLGTVVLADDVRVSEHDLTGKEGLLAVLRGRAPTRTVDELRGAHGLPPRRARLAVTVRWTPRAPVMVRADADGVAVDSLPLTGRQGDGTVRLVLPGSSIKGALRVHTARILRTVSATPAPRSTGADERGAAFRAQLAQLELVTALFGAAAPAAPRPRPAQADPDADQGETAEGGAGRHGVGALRVEDCRSTLAVEEQTWRKITTVPAYEPAMLDRLRGLGLDRADHVAVDRWTGGAADQLLFAVLEPWKVGWEDIRLTVDRTRLRHLGELVESQALALLLLVLRDLRLGRVPLGHATNRGFGDLTAEVEVSGPQGPMSLEAFLVSAEGAPLVRAWRTRWAGEGAA